ncbi:MAG TPA: hypothetical protein VEV17_00375 [Bryobacteraceae bacterium]|nr:hypothetical protein [Bryobacteraceae bacterium]
MKDFITLLFIGALAASTGFAQKDNPSAGAGTHMMCGHNSAGSEKQAADQSKCACGMPECSQGDCKCDMTKAAAKGGCCGEEGMCAKHDHAAMSTRKSAAGEKQTTDQSKCACGMPECSPGDCKCDMTKAAAKGGCCGEEGMCGKHDHAAMSTKASAAAPRRSVGAVARTQARFGRLPAPETAAPAAKAKLVASADTKCSMPDKCCNH